MNDSFHPEFLQGDPVDRPNPEQTPPVQAEGQGFPTGSVRPDPLYPEPPVQVQGSQHPEPAPHPHEAFRPEQTDHLQAPVRPEQPLHAQEPDPCRCPGLVHPPQPAAPEHRKRHPLRVLAVLVLCACCVGIGYYANHVRDEMRSLRLRFQSSRTVKESAVPQNSREEKEAAPAQGALKPYYSIEEAAARSDGQERPLKVYEIAERATPAVVAISTERAYSTPFGNTLMPVAGSGFLISEDGYIVTNNHVVDKAKTIKVRLRKDNQNADIYEAKVVGTDALSDLAVIKIEGKDGEKFPTLQFGDSDALKVGELSVAIGNPTGTLEGSVTSGIISALARDIQVQGNEMTLIQTDAAINSGNSGGALLNSFGQVVGINTAKLQGMGENIFEGLGFAIPSRIAEPIIESLIRYGYLPDRVYMGVSVETVEANVARYYRIADSAGVLIRKVVEGGPADQAGLREGDFIIGVDKHPIDSINALNNLKKSKKPGDRIQIHLMREGKEMNLELVLGRTPKPES